MGAYRVYTHFTSPIRRYPDVMVHRILQAALTQQPQPESKEDLKEICEKCNERKVMADRASDRSDVVFLCHYLKEQPPQEYEGYVYRVTAKGFDVMCPYFGIEDTVMLDRVGLVQDSSFDAEKHTLTCTFDSYNDEYFVKPLEEQESKPPLTVSVAMFQKVCVIPKVKESKRELDMGLRVVMDET